MTTKKQENEKKGLTTEQALELQKNYGKNRLADEKKEGFFRKILEVLKEPMFLLLIVAAVIYFILGEPRDGAIMLIFVIAIIAIDVIQQWKTDKTLKALKELSAPHIKVIRDGVEKIINSEDLVPGDLMIIEEGIKIPADGKILKSNDLAVNESSLTGEAEAVWKINTGGSCEEYWRRDYCYGGTLVTQGSGYVLVEKIGANTEQGKIAVNIAKAPEIETPMEKQTGKLVKVCAIIAFIFFLLVCSITYLNLSDHMIKERLIESILSGVTLAMAMIPEEFPVILTVFLSMGAFRLARKNSLIRKLPSVETLGAVSVLCVDKTGTITMNKMSIAESFAINGDEKRLTEVMGLACEEEPYDPMEQGMLQYCKEKNFSKEELFNGKLITEYSFTNNSKMMGHVWDRNGEIIIAAKGSPERILNISNLTEEEKKVIEEKIYKMSSKGLRVIAIAEELIDYKGNIPNCLELCKLNFLGIVGLYDPPREGIKNDIESCIKAGIRVVMITGDNGITASAIANKVGIKNSDKIITGDQLNSMSESELKEKVKTVSIFSRVIPEHKMRIVNAFKENGEVVAMTGDGVNDAAALKYADIGIAMGKRGSEVSREAADLILLDDNFSTIINTVKDGRRIYDNIRKAVGYVFTIHIPIAFASLIGPMLGLKSSMLLLLPLHVVLLEVLIDPTCSIVLERQPAEDDIMERKPRNPRESIINSKILIKSIIQGIVLFLASFGAYYLTLRANPNEVELARSMGLAIIILSNLLLVQVNSSDKDFVYQSMKKLKKDKVMWITSMVTIIGIGVILYTPIARFLGLTALPMKNLFEVIAISFIAVMWYEVVKLFKKIKRVS